MIRLIGTVLLRPRGFFENLRVRIRNLKPVYQAGIDKSVRNFFVRQFATRGRAGGTPWEPLAASTLAIKRKFGKGSAGILRRGGRLWNSLTKPFGPDVRLRITRGTYERWTQVPYADQHQKGYTISTVFGKRLRAPKRVPARPLAPDPLPAALLGTWGSLAATYVDSGAV